MTRSGSIDLRALLLAAALLGAAAAQAHALRALPGSLRLRGAPGERVASKLEIVNDGKEVARVDIDFQPQKGSSATWLTVSKKHLSLKPGRRAVVSVLCTVPQADGEVFGTLGLRSRSPGQDWYELRLTQPVYLRVAGSERAGMAIESLKARREPGDVRLDVALRNVGNMSVMPKVVAEWTAQDGGRSARVLEPQTRTVFPGETETFQAALKDGPSGKLKGGRISVFYKNQDGQVERMRRAFTLPTLRPGP